MRGICRRSQIRTIFSAVCIITASLSMTHGPAIRKKLLVGLLFGGKMDCMVKLKVKSENQKVYSGINSKVENITPFFGFL